MSRAMSDFRADVARYRQDRWLVGRWWIHERSIWAVAVFRLGQRILEMPPAATNLLSFPYTLLHTLTQAATGIELYPTTRIGPGMRIYHGQGIVINAGAVLGAGVVLRQGVTIGARRQGGSDFPVIGDNVEFGAYAQVFGAVRVGDRARIGSLSVVLHDVDDDVAVMGAPAKPGGRATASSSQRS